MRPGTNTAEAMEDTATPKTTETVGGAGLYRLTTWLSPNFPVGAFAYSHGIEFAVEDGLIRDCPDLTRWVEGVVSFGAGRLDAALFRAAWEAIAKDDAIALREASEWGGALRGTSELALESASQGRAFLDTVMRVWPEARLARWREELSADGREPAHAVAVGVAAALAEVPLKPALVAYLHAFASNLVSAALRLVPLGQTDGQRAMAELEKTVISSVEAAIRRAPGDLGGAALTVDWASMRHETQYTRLFRS